ncbi:hypothetical protein F5888DRAFT_1701719 [Russula emetica]|nr:hypothetical protein F5888DRAFT_1701719 [Russula emetica]
MPLAHRFAVSTSYSRLQSQSLTKCVNAREYKLENWTDLNVNSLADLITIDDEIIIDNQQELDDILVKPLPTGSSLFALLDTCHSGTLLDLPSSTITGTLYTSLGDPRVSAVQTRGKT